MGANVKNEYVRHYFLTVRQKVVEFQNYCCKLAGFFYGLSSFADATSSGAEKSKKERIARIFC